MSMGPLAIYESMVCPEERDMSSVQKQPGTLSDSWKVQRCNWLWPSHSYKKKCIWQFERKSYTSIGAPLMFSLVMPSASTVDIGMRLIAESGSAITLFTATPFISASTYNERLWKGFGANMSSSVKMTDSSFSRVTRSFSHATLCRIEVCFSSPRLSQHQP